MKIARLVVSLAAPIALAACGSGNEKADDAEVPVAEELDAVPAAVPEAPVDVSAETPSPETAVAPPEDAETPPAAPEVASSGPPDSFMICSSCHAVEPGKNGIGPSLAGIYGNKAASAPGYAYSEPLKKANITWTDSTLDKWLEAPMKLVPGTRMVFGGIPDAAKRKELIAYMKTL